MNERGCFVMSIAVVLLALIGIGFTICFVGWLLSDALYYICDISVEFFRTHRHVHG